MPNTDLLSPWVRRFLLEYLVAERNLARNTQKSYRDALQQFLPFIARAAHRRMERLRIDDVSPARTRGFLQDLEKTRHCGIATRNQRLAAIRSLARFIGLYSPEHLEWSGQIRTIASKKVARPLIGYLEKDELDALLKAPDHRTPQGRRDYAVLLFLYNTGARADEVAQMRMGDLDLGAVSSRDASSVVLHGKGNKLRRCPLWPKTVDELRPLIDHRALSQHVFLNRRGRPITRFGIHALVERYAARVAMNLPSVANKRVSPHTIRHTTATHLLRAGVDINTIRAWLGHVSISTTNVYAEVDLEMKAKALAKCEIQDGRPKKPWRKNPGIMEFLRSL
ncbi:MAG: tyrosine-type recombinase/integrase [Planctomycetota bacterium]